MNLIKHFKQVALAQIDHAIRGAAIFVQWAEDGSKLHLATTERGDTWPTWTTHTGARVDVRRMGFDHLFYAIAKASRGEYPDSHARRTGVEALKREALRRLAYSVAGVQL